MSGSTEVTNLEQLKASRRQPNPGDIFVLKLKPLSKFVFGKVISDKAMVVGFPLPNYLVYIYNTLTDDIREVPELSRDNLLIDPAMVNRQGWLKGYFQTVAHEAIRPTDFWQSQCFFSQANNRYYSEDGQVLESPSEPVFMAGLGNHRTIEDRICLNLGIPLAPGP